MFCRRCYRNRGYYRNNQQNEISFNELKDKVSKGAILIDVRSPQEYNEGHLPEALNIPEYEIRKVKNKEYKLPFVIPIVLYTGKKKWDAKIKSTNCRILSIWWKK